MSVPPLIRTSVLPGTKNQRQPPRLPSRDITRIVNPTVPTLPPESICGYTIVRACGPSSFIAIGPAGRKVVLKRLDPDCLLQGQLHPSIKERLARVRELALKTGANLHGVERDSHGAFLVWEFIEGLTLEESAAQLDSDRLTELAREIVLAVESQHALGIIHGALHARNVIIDDTGRPRITHISPLLYDEPSVDERAVVGMLAEIVRQRDSSDSQLGRIVNSETAGRLTLRQLAAGLATLSASGMSSSPVDEDDRRPRRLAMILALAVAVLGVLIAVVTYFAVRGASVGS